jgi:hypothetical protein
LLPPVPDAPLLPCPATEFVALLLEQAVTNTAPTTKTAIIHDFLFFKTISPSPIQTLLLFPLQKQIYIYTLNIPTE